MYDKIGSESMYLFNKFRKRDGEWKIIVKKLFQCLVGIVLTLYFVKIVTNSSKYLQIVTNS